MQYRLDHDHYIGEQVLPAGTIIGDDTPWPFRQNGDDPKSGRKNGDPLPPSTSMSPVDDEAKRLHKAKFGTDAPERDPTASIPLTGAPGAPVVRGPAAQAVPVKTEQTPVNPKPIEPPKTGMIAEPAKAPDAAKKA